MKTFVVVIIIFQVGVYNIQSVIVNELVGSIEGSSSEFCHVNNFSDTSSNAFCILHPIHVKDINATFVMHQVNTGSPFVVSGVTRGWKASDKWVHSFFKSLFQKEQLFSSTFSTLNSPQFCDDTAGVCEDHSVYYGVFLNNPQIAEYLYEDYQYPEFIPEEWWVKGM